MLYKYKQLLEQFSEDPTFIYHYFTEKNTIKSILNSGGLKSISSLMLGTGNPEYEKYRNRDNTKSTPEEYFEKMYNKLIKDVVKKPYTTTGLYFTTCDLFQFENKFIARVKIPIDKALKYGPTTLSHGRQYGSKVILLKNDSQLRKELKVHPYPDNVKDLYWEKPKTYLFENLPQVAVWTDFIPVTKDMIEVR